MMFGEDDVKREEEFDCYNYRTTYGAVSCRVWQDIERQLNRSEKEDAELWSDYGEDPTPKTILEKVARSFSSRYYYLSFEGTTDLSRPDLFFGTDPELIEECKSAELESEKLRKELYRKEDRVRKELGLDRPGRLSQRASKEDLEKYWKICGELDRKWDKHSERDKLYDWYREESIELSSKHQKAAERIAEADAKYFLENNPDAFILFTNYDDSSESLMEHGRIFRNLSHVQVSHH